MSLSSYRSEYGDAERRQRFGECHLVRGDLSPIHASPPPPNGIARRWFYRGRLRASFSMGSNQWLAAVATIVTRSTSCAPLFGSWPLVAVVEKASALRVVVACGGRGSPRTVHSRHLGRAARAEAEPYRPGGRRPGPNYIHVFVFGQTGRRTKAPRSIKMSPWISRIMCRSAAYEIYMCGPAAAAGGGGPAPFSFIRNG